MHVHITGITGIPDGHNALQVGQQVLSVFAGSLKGLFSFLYEHAASDIIELSDWTLFIFKLISWANLLIAQSCEPSVNVVSQQSLLILVVPLCLVPLEGLRDINATILLLSVRPSGEPLDVLLGCVVPHEVAWFRYF